MAKAPRPGGAGTTGGNEKEAAAQQVMRVTLRGEVREFRPGMVDFQTRAIVRKATGLPLEAYLGDESSIGEDSLQVLWWLAGRTADPFLTLTRVLAEWPRDLSPDDIDVTVDDGVEDDDPEA